MGTPVDNSPWALPKRSHIASIQQATHVVVLVGVAVLIWLGTRFDSNSASTWALAVALVLLCTTPILIGIQCVWMQAVNRHSVCAPKLSLRGLMWVWLHESATALRIFGYQQPFAWKQVANNPAAQSGQRGVIFIHGYFCNRGLWNAQLAQCHAQGIPAIALNLEPAFASIDAYAPLVEEAVQAMQAATGQHPVLVCHSMGGLAARAWFRSSPSRAVHRIITIGTPHHGTALASTANTPNGRQMQVGSAWLAQLLRDEAAAPTPVAGLMHCVYSNGDNIVFPAASACLVGGTTHHIAACGHVALAFRPEVTALWLASLSAGR